MRANSYAHDHSIPTKGFIKPLCEDRIWFQVTVLLEENTKMISMLSFVNNCTTVVNIRLQSYILKIVSGMEKHCAV